METELALNGDFDLGRGCVRADSKSAVFQVAGDSGAGAVAAEESVGDRCMGSWRRGARGSWAQAMWFSLWVWEVGDEGSD